MIRTHLTIIMGVVRAKDNQNNILEDTEKVIVDRF